jgi:PAS domain S-box-containing protein
METGHLPAEEDARRMVHELQVHQIELELQNEELIKAREELEKELRRYSDLYDFAPVGYFTLDENGTILETNLTSARLLGIDRSHMKDRRFGSFLSAESRPGFDACLRKAFEGAAVETCEVALQGDRLRYLQIEGTTVEYGEGKTGQCRMAAMDVTGRKEAEERLRVSEERHRSYIEVTGELGWTTNRHGEVVEDLPTWRNFTGQSVEEIRGAGWANALHPDDVEQTMNAWNNAVVTRKAYEVEYRIRRHDGMYRDFLARGVPVSNHDGSIREWVGTCIDITERKASEEILRRYELLSQNSRDIVLLMRRDDGRIVEANIAATNAYSYSRAELLKLAINDLRASETLGMTNGQMAQADRRGILFETVHRRKDGSTFPVEVSSQGATIDGTRMLISVIRDTTQRSQMERALRLAHDGLELRVQERTAELERAYEALRVETDQRQSAERDLRQAQKIEALGMLAGGIAHDFNNILAGVIGFAELAKDETPEGSLARSYMEKVFIAGIRGRDLVRQILTFSRQAEQEKRPLQLATVVEETLKLLRPALPTTIDIQTNLQSESGFVLVDSTQIQQVVLNLCTNGAHAMRRTGGGISIDLSEYSFSFPADAPDPAMSPGPYVRLSVSDTGEGMSSDILERIFDPFFTTKPRGEGTGLGLSVVHGIVASHGGTITVSSELGKGSSFTVYLPKHREHGPRDSTGGDGAIPRGHERVLFIDDEEDLAAIGDQMLTGLGYRVVSKTRSREALALFRLNPSVFDVVVTDQTMPELTGIELAKEMLALRPDMPIIMCTGFSHVVDAGLAKVAGIKAFAVKPLIKKEIAQTIRGVLDKES